jgi:uncharacterized membrane protein YphA (DoxX/SURF4 family)
MKKMQPWVTFIARLILGGTLFAAGWIKLFNSYEAKASVRAYDLLPVGLANILGAFLPTFEIALALFIIIGVWTKRVAIIGTVLMAIFVIAISQAWARGLPINCGCFGNGGLTADGKVHNWTYLSEILRDLGLILCGIYISRNPIGKFALDKEESKDGE